MKALYSVLIAFSIAFSPFAMHAQTPAQPQAGIRASEYNKAVGNVVYSLQTLPDVLNELRLADVAADRGVTKTTSETIYLRLSTALELIHVVASDRSMTQAQRDAVQQPLFVHIGQAMHTLLRQHQNDNVQRGRTVDPLPGLDRTSIVNMLKSTPGVLWNRVGLGFKEALMDAKSLVTVVRSGDLKTDAARDAALVARINASDARRTELEKIVADYNKEAKKPETTVSRKQEIQ
ncbi:MAG: hypothetical protein AAB250_19690, partial [Bdellovibrionota bacterium]